MGESSSAPEQGTGTDGKGITNPTARIDLVKLMDEVDKLMPSPEQRALKVWESLGKQGLNIWDLVCFCTETLGYTSTLFPEFEDAAKAISLNVYATHYRGAKTVLDWSQRPENQLDTIKPDDLTKP